MSLNATVETAALAIEFEVEAKAGISSGGWVAATADADAVAAELLGVVNDRVEAAKGNGIRRRRRQVHVHVAVVWMEIKGHDYLISFSAFQMYKVLCPFFRQLHEPARANGAQWLRQEKNLLTTPSHRRRALHVRASFIQPPSNIQVVPLVCRYDIERYLVRI